MKDNYKSRTMSNFMEGLDNDLYCIEETIREQNIEIKRLEKENNKYLNESIQDSQNVARNTLNAILSTPKLKTLSSTILSKIKNMDNITDVHKYIDKVFKDNFEEREVE